MLNYKNILIEKKCLSRQIRFLNTFKPQSYSFSAHKKIKCGLQMQYNNLKSPHYIIREFVAPVNVLCVIYDLL